MRLYSLKPYITPPGQWLASNSVIVIHLSFESSILVGQLSAIGLCGVLVNFQGSWCRNELIQDKVHQQIPHFCSSALTMKLHADVGLQMRIGELLFGNDVLINETPISEGFVSQKHFF